MTKRDDDDAAGETIALGAKVDIDPTRDLDEVLGEVEALLKRGDVGEALAARAVNTSLALLALDGLRAYLVGDKAQAADDLGTVAEEIASRLARAAVDAGARRGEGPN
jgi:hypothetical protein